MQARSLLPPLVVVAAALSAGSPAGAAVVPFTGDPAGAIPALTGPGTAFTADAFTYDLALRGVGAPSGAFAAHRLEPLTGFSLNGAPVSPLGFGSAYGLYLDIQDIGIQSPPGPLVITSATVTLKADPGNHNGAAFASAGGIGFANTGPSGTADDIVLASGIQVGTSASVDPVAGTLNGETLYTFSPAAGQAGFFLSPLLDGANLLDLFTSNPLAGIITTPQPDGTVVTTINGFTGTGQFVPEPGSMMLLGAGLIGFAPFLRRRP